MSHFLLEDPGLVVNAADGMSCLHACVQMAMRTRSGGSVLSFNEMCRITGHSRGKYSYDYALLDYLAFEEFRVVCIQTFDAKRFVREGARYLLEFYGPEVGSDLIENSEVQKGIAGAKRFLENDRITVELRLPRLSDIKACIKRGFYAIIVVNQRILQGDPGYVSHSIFVYGFSERGVRIHNPGPPASSASEIPWSTLEKAWSYPDRTARNIVAIKPPRD